MTTLEHLEAARIMDEARRAKEAGQYNEVVRLKNENAVLRSEIEKLKRQIEQLEEGARFWSEAYNEVMAERDALKVKP